MSPEAVVAASEAQGDGSVALSVALARAEHAEACVRELEAERDLYRPQRELLQAITDRVLAGILVFDGEEFRVKWANPASRRMLDEPYRTQVDIVGLRVEEFLPRAEKIGLHQLLNRVAATGQAEFDPEWQYDGFERGTTYWRWSIVPLPTAPGTTPDLVAVVNELTEQVAARRQVEALAERLATEQRFLNGIMDNIPAAITYLDENLIYRQCNQAAAAEMGHPLEAILGRHLRELHADNPQVCEAIEGVLRTGQAFRSEELPVVWRDRRAEGTHYFTVAYLPDKDPSGQVRGIIAEGQRVTALVEARQRLQEAKDRLEERVRERTAELSQTVAELRFQANIVANVSDAVVATDAENRIAFFNRAAEEMYGWRAAEVIGKLPGEVLRSEFISVSREQVYQELYERGSWRGEVIVYRRDGSPIYADSIGVLLKDDAGRIVGHIGVNRDISERKRAEERLRESRAQLAAYSRLLVETVENERRNLARELHDQAGQAMAALKLSLGHLRRAADGYGPQAARLDEMEQLIDGVMDDLHRLAMNLRPVSLDRFGLIVAVQQYVEFYRQQSGLAVDLVTVGIEQQRLPADLETTIYRVVQEALTNVLRHAKAQRVGVMIQRQSAQVLAIIEDDGRGFDVAEALRCNRLGLVGMRERVEVVGGTLTIESAPGKGATVYAVVPITD